MLDIEGLRIQSNLGYRSFIKDRSIEDHSIKVFERRYPFS